MIKLEYLIVYNIIKILKTLNVLNKSLSISKLLLGIIFIFIKSIKNNIWGINNNLSKENIFGIMIFFKH